MAVNHLLRPDLAPQRLVKGKRYEDWTDAERRDAALWELGPAFRRGLKPPPTPVWSDIPAVPGSAADGGNAWQGSMARVEARR